MKTLAIAAAALGLACTTAAPARAQTIMLERLEVPVRLSDINLATAAGQELLHRRIDRAARQVCRITNVNTGTRIMNHDARACLAKARADARQQVALLTGDRQRGG